MYQSSDARELLILLRISRTLDIVGDVSATVDNPSELLAWANTLADPAIFAWRADASGKRYVHVTATNSANPIHGRVTAILPGDLHKEFWCELFQRDLEPGAEQPLTLKQLSAAWTAMPITAPRT